MSHSRENRTWALVIRWPAALATAIVLALTLVLMPSAQAQSYKVIYNFTGGQDGAYPLAGLTMDAAGNLYGTASYGGYSGGSCAKYSGCGTVFKLIHKGSGWTFNPLYMFQGDFEGNNDAANPAARVVFGPDGSLYGTTEAGGGGSCSYYGYGCGAVFKLSPPPTACKTALCPWTDTVLYGAAADKGELLAGEVVFDQAGNLYSTVALGGQYQGGYIFELTPSYNGWTRKILYSFNPESNCNDPQAGLVFDASGDLLGTANTGCAFNVGGVFQLTPSGGSWTESIVHSFNDNKDGDGSMASLTPDGHGGFYGTTFDLGPNSGGTVFQLTPSNGGWMFSLVYAFGIDDNGEALVAPVTLDANGNLYGTNFECLHCRGTVFKLTPSNGTWTETVLHRFTGSDGSYPYSNVAMDANGNLYGTASSGGAYGYGVIWEITP